MKTELEKTIEDAAQLIAEFDSKLANKWRAEPFSRMAIASAFANGFGPKAETDDPAPAALAVFHVATLDKEARRLAMLQEMDSVQYNPTVYKGADNYTPNNQRQPILSYDTTR